MVAQQGGFGVNEVYCFPSTLKDEPGQQALVLLGYEVAADLPALKGMVLQLPVELQGRGLGGVAHASMGSSKGG